MNFPISVVVCQSKWNSMRDYFMRTKKKGGTGSSATVKNRMERLTFLIGTALVQRAYDSFNLIISNKIIKFDLNKQIITSLSLIPIAESDQMCPRIRIPDWKTQCLWTFRIHRLYRKPMPMPAILWTKVLRHQPV